LSHDHVLDLAVLDPGAVEPRSDHERAEVGRLVAGEPAAELPERRADGGDDDGAGHALNLPGVGHVRPQAAGERDEQVHARLEVGQLDDLDR
jgi:hypothetical protein